MARIRQFRPSDFPALLALYRTQTAPLTLPAKVRRQQFERDLFTTRMMRNPADHNPKAKFALVAVDNRNRIRAFINGGLALKGDEVIIPRTGYIQEILAHPAESGAIGDLVAQAVTHLRRFRPVDILAYDGSFRPIYSGLEVCCLPSAWSGIGQVLVDGGFEVAGRSKLMTRSFAKKRPLKPKLPRNLEFHHCRHEMFGYSKRHDFGCLLLRPPYSREDGVAWCGNFYSGAFIAGSGFRSLYINWFTVMNEDDRGKGYGRLLLQHCLHEGHARGAKEAALLTDVDNFVAQNLYCSEGFEVEISSTLFVTNRSAPPSADLDPPAASSFPQS